MRYAAAPRCLAALASQLLRIGCLPPAAACGAGWSRHCVARLICIHTLNTQSHTLHTQAHASPSPAAATSSADCSLTRPHKLYTHSSLQAHLQQLHLQRRLLPLFWVPHSLRGGCLQGADKRQMVSSTDFGGWSRGFFVHARVPGAATPLEGGFCKLETYVWHMVSAISQLWCRLSNAFETEIAAVQARNHLRNAATCIRCSPTAMGLPRSSASQPVYIILLNSNLLATDTPLSSAALQTACAAAALRVSNAFENTASCVIVHLPQRNCKHCFFA